MQHRGCSADYNVDLAALAAAGICQLCGQFAWLSPTETTRTVCQGLLGHLVPDGGMTLMLLGGTLVGVGTLRRKFRV